MERHFSEIVGQTGRDPFVDYVIEHDLSGSRHESARRVLDICNDGGKHTFGEMLKSVNPDHGNLKKLLERLIVLTAAHSETFGFKFVKSQGENGRFIYYIQPNPNRPVEPAPRNRKLDIKGLVGPDEIDIGDVSVKLRERYKIALESAGFSELSILPEPNEDLDAVVDNASWFFPSELSRRIVAVYVQAAKSGKAVNTNALATRFDLHNGDTGVRYYERDTIIAAPEVGFVIAYVRRCYYTLLQLDPQSRIHALRRKYGEAGFRNSTYMDKLEEFSMITLSSRLRCSDDDEAMRNLVVAVAGAQLQSAHLSSHQARKVLGCVSNYAVINGIAASRHNRYKNGYFLRFRRDNTIECRLLDKDCEVPMHIKPQGVRANY
ncbi:hypothetical protein HY463_01120 [Candidatus Peregrinibacteria bacterium]|nr:hypothetical protein [Candidatus Peregrinibacteria bacterium]